VRAKRRAEGRSTGVFSSGVEFYKLICIEPRLSYVRPISNSYRISDEITLEEKSREFRI